MDTPFSVSAHLDTGCRDCCSPSRYGHLMDFLPDMCSRLIGSNIQIVVHLKSKPETGGIAEVARQSECSVSRDAASPVYDLVDPARRHVQIVAQPVLAEAKRLHEFLKKDCARMDWWYPLHLSAFVVVHDLDGMGVSVAPHEADPPCVVDPYAMLSLAVPQQRLKPVPRWYPEVFNRRAPMKHAELSKSSLLHGRRQLPGVLPIEDLLRFLAPEALYHERNL